MYRVVYKTLIALLLLEVHMLVYKALIVVLLVLEAHTSSTFMWDGGEHCINSSSSDSNSTNSSSTNSSSTNSSSTL